MIFLSLIQMVFMVVIILYEYHKRSVSIFMWATLWLMFGMMHLLTCVAGYTEYSVETLNKASLFVILFEVVYISTRVIVTRLVPYNGEEAVEIREMGMKTAQMMLGILVVATLWYFYKVYAVSGNLLEMSKANVYKMNSATTVVDLIVPYLYIATAPVFLYFLINHKKKEIIISGTCIVVKSLTSGSRMDFIILFAAIICYVAYYAKRQLTLKKLILLACIGLLTIYAIYALRTYRHYNGLGIFLSEFEIVDFHKRMGRLLLTGNGELGYLNWFYQFIEGNNAYSGFGTGEGYKRLCLLPIPSFFLDGMKPQDFCRTMAIAIDPDFPNWTITPTLFGDCFANNGMWGSLYGILWGMIVAVLDKIAYRKSQLMRAMCMCLIATQFINIGRGEVYNSIGQIYYGSVIMFIMCFGYKWLRWRK